MIQFIKNLFSKKSPQSDDLLSNVSRSRYIIITGDKNGLSKRINEMIDQGKNIKHTTISKDFEKYGHSEKFVMGIYYD